MLLCRIELYRCKPFAISWIYHCRKARPKTRDKAILAGSSYGGRTNRSTWWLYFRHKVVFQWLNQTSDLLTYTPGYVCNGNSPKCILTDRFVGNTGEGPNITLTSEEDTRLCRLANGDLDDMTTTLFQRISLTPEDEIKVSLSRLSGQRDEGLFHSS